jgi:tRNA pseudouridine55 synthase
MEIDQLAAQFTNGKILLLNKPLYWTSYDLVRKVKGIIQSRLNIKKLKVGHAGTLDPLATGLMIICTGKETKNIEQYQSGFKEYIAMITLGATTPSFDLETDIDHQYPVDHILEQQVISLLESLKGIQLQKPPHFSARFVNGTRAYKLARKGESVELDAREIEIRHIEMISFRKPVLEIRVVCSKGTYIRALARDIGFSLGSGGHLTGLNRTAIGSFSLKDAMGIEEFQRNLVLL